MPDPVGDAVAWLRRGGLLAYPTETVWGLGADAKAERALERLRRWKRRDESEPVAILVESVADLGPLGFEVGRAAERLAAAFWPGPLTLILSGGHGFARGVARADGAVGVRCSAHPLAAAIARRARTEGVGPITATSLNASGETPARTRDAAGVACGEGSDQPHMIEVDQAESGGDEASTVVDATGQEPRVLRWGTLPAAKLEPVLREIAAS